MKPTKFNIKEIPHGNTAIFFGCLDHSGLAFGNADFQQEYGGNRDFNYYIGEGGSGTGLTTTNVKGLLSYFNTYGFTSSSINSIFDNYKNGYVSWWTTNGCLNKSNGDLNYDWNVIHKLKFIGDYSPEAQSNATDNKGYFWSFSANFAFGGGTGFSFGQVTDSNNETDWFFSLNGNLGLSASAVFEKGLITPTNRNHMRYGFSIMISGGGLVIALFLIILAVFDILNCIFHYPVKSSEIPFLLCALLAYTICHYTVFKGDKYLMYFRQYEKWSKEDKSKYGLLTFAFVVGSIIFWLYSFRFLPKL